jgi:T-complex protein 1 subunit zeta
VLLDLIDTQKKEQVPVGIDAINQGHISPVASGILDNYVAKRQWLNIAPTLAQQLLLVDEIMRAGKGMGGGGEGPQGP